MAAVAGLGESCLTLCQLSRARVPPCPPSPSWRIERACGDGHTLCLGDRTTGGRAFFGIWRKRNPQKEGLPPANEKSCRQAHGFPKGKTGWFHTSRAALCVRKRTPPPHALFPSTAGNRSPVINLALGAVQVEEYKDRATFVHMYGPEPHPATPGTNFDTGSVWQMFWSTFPQHRSYQDRLAMADRISGLVHPDQVSTFVDDLRSCA